MKPAEVEQILKLMNRYGCTKLSLQGSAFEVPTPKRPLTDELLSISDAEVEIVNQIKQTLTPSAPENDDDVLFYHEKFDDDSI